MKCYNETVSFYDVKKWLCDFYDVVMFFNVIGEKSTAVVFQLTTVLIFKSNSHQKQASCRLLCNTLGILGTRDYCGWRHQFFFLQNTPKAPPMLHVAVSYLKHLITSGLTTTIVANNLLFFYTTFTWISFTLTFPHTVITCDSQCIWLVPYRFTGFLVTHFWPSFIHTNEPLWYKWFLWFQPIVEFGSIIKSMTKS